MVKIKFGILQKTVVFLTTIIISLVFCNITYAAQISIEADAISFGVGDEVVISVYLDTEGEILNAFQGKVVFSNNIFDFRTIKDGGSIVSLWIEKPVYNNEAITFAGITPGGFMGKEKLFSFIVVPKQEGVSLFEMKDVEILENDGRGTKTKVVAVSLAQVVSGTSLPTSTTKIIDRTPPEPFMLSIASDPNLFNGRYFLVFNTQDKDSGIERYTVYESKDHKSRIDPFSWLEAESPYVLQDQKLQSYIYVRALDRAGNEQLSILAPKSLVNDRQFSYIWWMIGGGVLTVILIVWILWYYKKRKEP